jgi:type VI secretion system protein ImpA
MASGELPPAANGTPDQLPSMARIEAAFLDTDLKALTALDAAVRGSLEELGRLEELLTDRVGTSRAPSFDPLRALVSQAARVVSPRVASRTRTQPAAVAAGDDMISSRTGISGAVNVSVSGDLRSREDVVLMLDKICAYYERNEPSSPVPLLVRRAKRLATMNFVDIVKDLVPDAMSALQVVRGPDDGSS